MHNEDEKIVIAPEVLRRADIS